MEIWEWADAETTDGYAKGVGPEWLDELTRINGFGQAMIDAGWLDLDGGKGILFPNWEVWNSCSAKARILNARRQQAWRARNGGSVT